MSVKTAIEQARNELDAAWREKFPLGEFRVEQSKQNNDVQILHFKRRPTSHCRSVCCHATTRTSNYFNSWAWMLNTCIWKFAVRGDAINKAIKLGMSTSLANEIHKGD